METKDEEEADGEAKARRVELVKAKFKAEVFFSSSLLLLSDAKVYEPEIRARLGTAKV